MIRARQIEKRYSSFQAVSPMDLDVHPGEVFGFLGLNGAGKTTALRILACDLRPSSGTVSVGGYQLSARAIIKTATFGKDIVLDANTGDTGPPELAGSISRINRVAVAIVAISDDRNRDG